jgi:hypothetical protein
MDAEYLGQLFVLVLFVGLALYFLRAATRPGARSTRLANGALCLGLFGLLIRYVGSGSSDGLRALVIAAQGMLALMTLVLVIVALRHRRGDGGGVARPVVAGVLGALELTSVAASILFSTFTSTSGAWSYRSPDGEFGLALPSGRWREGVMPGKVPHIMFRCSTPPMQAIIMSVRRDQTQSDFENAAGKARMMMGSKPSRHVQTREGVNTAGNTYRYSTTEDAATEDDGDRVFVAHCFTWKPSKQLVVEVLFEAPLTMASIDGKAAAAKAIATSAETICQSVD